MVYIGMAVVIYRNDIPEKEAQKKDRHGNSAAVSEFIRRRVRPERYRYSPDGHISVFHRY